MERQLACQEFEEHDTKGENIRPTVDFVSVDLFGRHVVGRAQHDAALGL